MSAAETENPQGAAAKAFEVAASHDGVLAFIPKGTPIAPDVGKWTLNQLKDYLKSLGFEGEIKETDYKLLVASAKTAAKGLAKDFVVMRGSAPEPMTPGKIEWLNPPSMPKDQLIKGRTFMRVTEPKPGKPGMSVKGQPIGGAGNKEKPKPMLKKIAKEFKQNEDGTIEATESGQAVLKGDELSFSPVYECDKPNVKELAKAEFFSSVHVKADLPATVVWKVHGDIHVDGHWSAGNIEVIGNATAESGIQTNMTGVLKVQGSLKSSYIQRSKIEVEGNISVESAILLCEIICKGELTCAGSPGAIMGSKLVCHGPLKANKVGSDRSVNTEIRIYRNKEGKKSTIGMLTQGTKMHVYEQKFIQQADMAFETAD